MAFPFSMATMFADGTRTAGYATTTDPNSYITFPHYTELARASQAPFRGAYCYRIKPGGVAGDTYIAESTSVVTALAASIFVNFQFYLGLDWVMADGDKVTLLTLMDVVPAQQLSCGIQRTGNNILVWVNQTQAAGGAVTLVIGDRRTPQVLAGTASAPAPSASALGRWMSFELRGVPAGAGAGVVQGWIDDGNIGTISTLTNAAIASQRLGLSNYPTTTTGTILFDQVIVSGSTGQGTPAAARIGRTRERFRNNNGWMFAITASASNANKDHMFIGEGTFGAAVTGTGTDAVLYIYDTDGVPGPGSDTGSGTLQPLVVLRNTNANELKQSFTDFTVRHGCYMVTAGSQVQAFISVKRAVIADEAGIIARGLSQTRVAPGGA